MQTCSSFFLTVWFSVWLERLFPWLNGLLTSNYPVSSPKFVCYQLQVVPGKVEQWQDQTSAFHKFSWQIGVRRLDGITKDHLGGLPGWVVCHDRHQLEACCSAGSCKVQWVPRKQRVVVSCLVPRSSLALAIAKQETYQRVNSQKFG